MKYGIYCSQPWPPDTSPTVPEQEARCRDFVDRSGGQVVGIYEDPHSLGAYGSIFDRGDWMILRDAIVQAEFDVLIFDRLELVLQGGWGSLTMMVDCLREDIRWVSVVEGEIPITKTHDMLRGALVDA